MKNNKLFMTVFAVLFMCFATTANNIKPTYKTTPGYTAIPDVNFEKRLIVLGIDPGTVDHQVPTAKIAKINNLDISAKNISDLTGIQDFVALETLWCDNNQLTTLDLSKNTALARLNCHHNQLTSLNVTQNTALTDLYCYNNKLTALDVSQNTALVVLECSENQLINLDVSKNTILKTLWCSVNQLIALDVTKNLVLASLMCSYNQLSILDVSKNIALFELHCNYNKLDRLNIKNGTNSKIKTLEASYNPGLMCIQADSDSPPIYGWTKDDTAYYSIIDCSFYTTIPDSNFEQALIDLGYDSGFIDHQIRTASIARVISLDVSRKSISNLTGIQGFTALKTLSCEFNELTALDLTQNTVLTNLNCGSNQLITLDLSKNIVLNGLYCYSNQLTALDLTQNSALKNLYCPDNQLNSLNISKCTVLDVLYCYGNQLTNLDVTKNIALKVLMCDSNQLSTLDITKNIALNTLSCSLNQLTALDITKNLSLGWLYCYNNQLTTLDLSKNIALTYLDCKSNQLMNLNIKNGKNYYITTFDATNNPNLGCIQADNVTPPIDKLWIKDATASYSITDCPSYTAIPDANFEQVLINLTLDIAPKDGKVLTVNISGVTSLDVSNKDISDLTGIQDFVALKTLYCSSNKLMALDVTKNIALNVLDCGSNQLTVLDVTKNTALNVLDCYSNQLISLDVTKNTALTHLFCDSNKLVNLNIKNGNNVNITDFDVTNNSSLSCIQADSATAPNSGWIKDDTAYYSTTDCNLATPVFEKDENLVSVYPNPAEDMVNIIIPSGGELKKVEVFSLTGQKVESTTTSQVSLKHLAKGEYLFMIETSAGRLTKKVIKK